MQSLKKRVKQENENLEDAVTENSFDQMENVKEIDEKQLKINLSFSITCLRGEIRIYKICLPLENMKERLQLRRKLTGRRNWR